VRLGEETSVLAQRCRPPYRPAYKGGGDLDPKRKFEMMPDSGQAAQKRLREGNWQPYLGSDWVTEYDSQAAGSGAFETLQEGRRESKPCQSS